MRQNKNAFIRMLSILSIIVLLLNMTPVVTNAEAHNPNDDTYDYELRFWEDEQPDIGFYINAAARYTLETVPEPSMGTTAGEWSVMNLLRGMYTGYDYLNDIEDGYFDNYLQRIEDYVEEKDGNLNSSKSTEWSRLILALSALDYDITNVAGYDFIEKLSESHKFSYAQGINGPIWEIIAMNTGNYQFYSDESNPDVNTYGKMIDYILEREIKRDDGTHGGWSLFGNQPDPDITGMALQALAPYYEDKSLYNQTAAESSYDEYMQAVERGIYTLADIQADNGAFMAFGNVNVESTVQVIVALTELGIDPLADSISLETIDETVDFSTDGAVQDGVYTDNMIDATLTFWADGSGSEPGVGGFKHVTTGSDGGGGAGNSVNAMATDQALYGLIAYDRFLKDENSLYDMTDMMASKEGKTYKEYKAKELEVNFQGLDGGKLEKKSPYSIIEIPDGASAEGKEFIEWNSKSDGSGTTYAPGEKLSMPDHDITLYAQSEQIEYEITYETNGGQFNHDIVETYTVDDEIKLPTDETIEKEGYIFTGWYDNDIFDGDKITEIPKGSFGDKTFYAKWQDEQEANQEAAKAVEKAIDNLPDVEEVKLTDKIKVEEAREAYDNLTEDAQDLVTNLDKLISLEKKLEGLSDEISITTNLKDHLVTKADKLTFDLWARDKDGNKISPSDIEVTNNDKTVPVNWNDDEKTSYTLDLEVGENIVQIIVKDDYVLEYEITREYAEDGEVIGTYTFSLEGFTIGLGHIIEPVQLDIIKGENAAEALIKALEDNGFAYEHTGSITNSFYLSYLLDGENSIYKTDPKVPQVLKDILEESGGVDETLYDDGELGEFHFNSFSGWMYSVNNIFPNVGFADAYLNDNDVMRVQYTLALGSDLGGGMAPDFYEVSNKDDLTRKIAEINSSDDKDEYLAIEEQKEAYDHAIDTLHKVDASQSETDEALDTIKKVEKDTSDKQAAQEIDDKITELPSVEELTLDDKEAVEEVRELYEQLSADEKEFVENINLLQSIEEKIKQLEEIADDQEMAAPIEEQIDKLPSIDKLTIKDKQVVADARTAYDDLSDNQKKLVKNIEKLEAAEKKIEELEKEDSRQEAADNVMKQISSIPSVNNLTISDKEAVEQARAAFDSLTVEEQALVENIDTLEELEKKMKKLEDEITKEQEEVIEVERQINALPSIDEVTLEDKEVIEQALMSYYGLTDKQKTLVENKDVLIELKEKLAELEREETSIDEVAAKEVELQINALPSETELTLAYKNSIKETRELYDSLTTSQQELVENSDKLESLEEKIIQLEKELADDQKAASAVEELITMLPSVDKLNLNDKKELEAARAEYESLTEDQKQHVKTLDKLIELEKKMEELEKKSDKSKLESALNKVKDVSLDKYTEESSQALKKAIEAGEQILLNAEASQKEVDDAIKAVEEAFNQLQEEETQKTPNPDKETSGPNKENPKNETKDPGTKTTDNQLEDNKNSGNLAKGSQRLPNTASNMFNYLLVGVLFLMLGSGLVIGRRKKLR